MSKPQSISPAKRKDLARLLTLLDDGDPQGLDQLAGFHIDRLPYLVGITGAAGVGKSLLISKLIGSRPSAPVGILAVDPTSPTSGGALLGDRIRMPNLPPGVFLRSVATRGATGGLSEKLIDMAAAMKAFGYEEVYIETVGIGQDEVAVRQVVDTLVVVEAPGLGDEVQAMKASPLSVADILVVNKSDKTGATQTAAILAETLGKPPIVTSALDGDGVPELAESIQSAKREAMESKRKQAADRRKFAWRFTNALARKWTDRLAQSAAEIVHDPARGHGIENLYQRIREIMQFLPDHVAVAVPDLDAAISDYQRLGFFLERRESFPAEKVETAFFNAGGFHIELLQATSADSPISKFVAERGGGIHHIAFEVDDLPAAERAFKARGAQTIGGIKPGTRGKQILFLHPKSTSRALLEFCSCGMQAEPRC